MSKTILLAFCITLLSCNSSEKDTNQAASDSELDDLFSLMQGSFNSAAQAKADSAYFNISLHMYPIWTHRDGNYLYVEQALNSMQDQPYRQRIYEVTQLDDHVISSAVYRLPDGTDSLYVGLWKTPEAFNDLSKDDLVIREGCAVLLKKVNDQHYKGSTSNQDCSSTLRGASYATSLVEIFQNRIVSWDQGWDSTSVQVWGAEKGGYVFDRIDL